MKSALALALVALVSLSSAPALAGSAGGVNMPDELEMYGTKLHLNGMGIREATVFNVNVYVAGLYVEDTSRSSQELISSDQIKVMHLIFVRDVDRSDVVDAMAEGFRNSADDYSAISDEVAEINSWLRAFEEGDTLTYTYRPGRGVRVAINNKTAGRTGDEKLGRALMGIWLGDDPPNGGLKRGLLGR